MATTTDTVSVVNHDIVGLVARIDRFTTELSKSASSSVSLMSSFDQDRLASYIGAIKKYKEWILASPQLDLPETHPTVYPVSALIPVSMVENESLGDVIRMMNLARQELINSQSSRLSSGLIIHDEKRFAAVIEKVANFLEEYIKAADPLDLPESSPAVQMTGAGRQGI